MSGRQLQFAMRRLQSVRTYTLALVDDVAPDDWFRQPQGVPTHVGWQVGHLAMAQYAVCLARRRGAHPDDRQLMSRAFRRKYGKGSTPDSQASNNPAPEEIRAVLDAVHNQALAELATEDEARLLEPLAAPHAMFDTLLGSLHFCADHEMLHAGQIGLIRRLLGKDPLR